MNSPEVILQLRTDPGEVGWVRATIRSPAWTRDAWFQVEGIPLRQDATPFIPPALLVAMRYRARLIVEGDVSPLLMKNLPAIQATFCVMRPRWRVADVRATSAPPTKAASGRAAFLSMGLDSLSTAIRRSGQLTHLIQLKRFGSDPPTAAARIRQGARELADRDGKTLLLVDSNIRELSRGVANWTRFHSAGIAAAAHALAPTIGSTMIAASMWQREMVTYASTPYLDPLWSSELTQLIHEGAELTRTEKAMAIAGDELAMRYVHPCFVAKGDEYNCARCGKCLRAMASLRVAGVESPPAFDRPLDLALLASQPGTIPVLDAPYRELLWAALTFAPQDTELLDAIRAAMIPPGSRLRRYQRLVQKRRAL